MPIRSIVLVTATVAVLGALLGLFFQVRSAPELEVPADALKLARAQYERTQARSATEDFQPDRGAAALPPRQPPAPGPAAAEPAGDERPEAPPAVRRSVSSVRPATTNPVMPPSSTAGQDRVRAAYDENDFETALSLAQTYLNEFPGDGYVQRVAGVSACAVGQEDIARKYYAVMNATDQSIVARRCSRYGIALQR
jgi:hypothetical protein